MAAASRRVTYLRQAPAVSGQPVNQAAARYRHCSVWADGTGSGFVDFVMALQEKSHLIPLADTFDENEVERNFLLSKPTCFLIVGKPGTGKAALGKKLSQTWNCIYIEVKDLINEHIRRETEQGIMIRELLFKGQSVHEEVIVQMIVDKINSAEVAHHGYVLCGLPSLSEEYMKVPEQIDLIKNFKLKPDVIINIKCPDKDLGKRLAGRKQDPDTGIVYQRQDWDSALKDVKKKPQEEGEEEAEEEELEEEEEEPENLKEKLDHLVHRPEDFPENVDESIQLYKDTLLRPVEDLMIDHDPQYLIELDGNKKADELFVSVIYRLESLGLRHGAVVMKLYNAEEVEILEGQEDDEIMRTLSSSRMIGPRYRWRRSCWGNLCPVALKEGYIKKGLAEFAVSFLDKMYLLSSEESLIKFMQNPRPYLLPPMPLPPCKIAVLGPKSSGKTSVCNLIANKYSGKIFDMSQLMSSYVKEAKQNAVTKACEESTLKAIESVKLKLQQEKVLKSQAQKEDLDDISSTHANKEHNVKENVEDLYTTEEHTAQKEEITEKIEMKNVLQTEDNVEESNTTEKQTAQNEEITEKTEQFSALHAEDQTEEVTADHPEVRQMVEESMKIASESPIALTPDDYINALEKAIKEFHEERKEQFPGSQPVGGWVVDNFPNSPNYWIPLMEKGLLPDTVICLRNAVSNGKYLLNRLYLLNEEEINNNILQRLQKERARKLQEEEEARKEQQEIMKFQDKQKERLEESQHREDKTEDTGDQIPTDQVDSQETISVKETSKTSVVETDPQTDLDLPLDSEPEITLPEVPEGGFPDVPEIEPLKAFVNTFNEEWQLLEPVFTDASQVNVAYLEVVDKSPETLLQEAVTCMTKPFQYHGWEVTSQDIDEEAEDMQAELEAEEQEGEEEEEFGREEAEEEDDDIISEKKKHYGDSKHFCPVALKDKLILQPGLQDNAAIYREKTYYCSSPEARKKFLENPENDIAHNEPLQPPPLRVLLIGTSGTGKTVNARWLAEKLGIFHIQFQERLQEIMLSKLQKKIGPQFEDDSAEEDSTDEAILLGLENGNMDGSQKEDIVNSKEEVVLTPEEEAVRSYLADNEPLPTEVLDQVAAEWWTKEPFCSLGFVLDGFPNTVEEVQYIGECGFFPDIAVLLEAEESDICDRLLPPRLAKWQERKRKKEEREQKLRDMKKSVRDKQIAKRREELLAEHKTDEERMGKKDPEDLDDEEGEEEAEEEADSIELILSEEFPEEEEEEPEDEEQEEDAIERMKTEIGEKCEADAESLQAVKEELQSLLIPCVTINAGRKPHIVHYQLYEKLKHIVENRESLFEKSYPINLPLANKMLHVSYKHPSIFGRWDPVKLSQGEVIKPFNNQENPGFPLLYRQYVYFFSTKENRGTFMKNPIKFIRQPKPNPSVPIRIAVVGPPKSGKTTIAKMFTSIYGLQRLSMGDAIRFMLENQPDTELALEIKNYLVKGLVVPDELAIKCLEVAMMDITCNTTGVVLDGYPATKQQADLLEAYSIIPIKIFELEISMQEVLKRGLLDKKDTKSMPYPAHDSAQILAVRNSNYKQEVQRIKKYYGLQHQNWCEIDAMHSKWWVSNKIIKEVQTSINQIQIYLQSIKEGKAAAIVDFCITPQELLSRLGEFAQYCPVSLAQRGELVDCSVTSSLQFAAEFRGHYYKMASQTELDAFLQNPELYVPPLAPRPLPPPEMLPKKLRVADVKSKFPKNAEMKGYCPVAYVDGKKRYEALVPGHIEHAVEYRDNIYIFKNEENLQRFMRFPEKYWNHKLPSKLPPKMEPVMLTCLPISGYLEQGAATALIKALNDVGCLKPKYPFLSVKQSALLYIAYHLKAFNPRKSDYIRNKYKKKMEQFVACCELITYLGNKMTHKYKEPQRRPADFDYKMQSFLSLKNVDPTCI
ncbi:adenylate kinase 9 isoform X2 [Pseudophryne corroboree]|uniref:adenylate kinase 9 isoform X2 n=1 Tax=Pseudophryne corroboree TaxID=495146 RepID=UPI00308133D8